MSFRMKLTDSGTCNKYVGGEKYRESCDPVHNIPKG